MNEYDGHGNAYLDLFLALVGLGVVAEFLRRMLWR